MLDAQRLQGLWYGTAIPPLHLRALAAVYGGVSSLRRALYGGGLLRRVRVGVPVIVAGNITAGGTGKTPLVIALCEALRVRGFRPGVVLRGYGGSVRAPTRVDAGQDAAAVGDEAIVIARTAQVPVAVGRDRAAAGRLLIQSAGVDAVIADDGLQHYRLCRDVEICVIDGDRRFGNGRLLPAGPLREPMQRAAACDFRVCNGGTPLTGEIAMKLAGEEAVAFGSGARRALSAFAGTRAHALAGIGNPDRFFTLLRAAGIDVVEHAFPDHHVFSAADIRFGDDLPVLMTEKDAVKCAGYADTRHWFVPVRAQLPEDFFDAIAARIRS